jgi:hypothetical protein
MEFEFERYDLRTLLGAYMQESKAFSTALENGEPWQSLQEKRARIRQIGALINKKYEELYGERRIRNKPPHGD